MTQNSDTRHRLPRPRSLGLIVAACLVATGGIGCGSEDPAVSEEESATQAEIDTTPQPPALPGTPVEFSHCQEFPDWSPPANLEEHKVFLEATGNPRYSDAPPELLSSQLAASYFNSAGGASAFADYYHLAGLWTLDPGGPGAVDFGSCATSDVPGQTQVWLKRQYALAASEHKGSILVQVESRETGIDVVELLNPDFAPIELRGEEPAWP